MLVAVLPKPNVVPPVFLFSNTSEVLVFNFFPFLLSGQLNSTKAETVIVIRQSSTLIFEINNLFTKVWISN